MPDAERRRSLRVLMVEDSTDDAVLLEHELVRGGFAVSIERVETDAAMRAALGNGTWDIVVSDYRLPTFSGPEALAVLQSTGLDLPFIIVSGTIGEETAVEALKAGAHDFIIKGRLARLLPAIDRELREAARRANQRELEERLHQAQKVELLGQLAGGIAHDFNNILTAMLGFCEMLLENAPDDSQLRRDLLEIQKAGERAAGLTRQLLAFSRKQVLQPKLHDLNALITGMEPMLRRLIVENIELKISLAPHIGLIRIDATQVEQILINLIVNACDAMPRGGELAVSTSMSAAPEGARVNLTVTDTGVGIDEKTRSRLFEPFFTTKAPGQGTGLGLATVAGIVKQHGGEIDVQSAPGKGTTFAIALPRAGGVAETAADRPVAETADGGLETVLIVEDEPAVRRLACRVLRRGGYQVLEAPDARDAMRIAREHPGRIDLLLSDVILPQSDGVPLAERCREARPDMRVLFMSGHTDEALIRHGGPESSQPFLQKPFSAQDLRRKVRETLDRVSSIAG